MNESKVQLASIFRRGGHKQELLGNEALPEQHELSEQLQQLAVAWALPKAKRGVGAAVWRPLFGAFEVIKRGSNQFNGQGFRRQGQLYLNIEEAVFMLDQGALLLLLQHDDGQQQLLSMQEALHMMVHLGVSQDRLQVLSHLCRLGFHVKRHPACWLVPSDTHPTSTWQTNRAWHDTDGLPLLQQQQQQPRPVAAAAGCDQLGEEGTVSAQQQQQQQQQVDSVVPDHKSRKKRRVDAAMMNLPAAAMDLDNQQQQQQEVSNDDRWWEEVPDWLKASRQQQQQRHDQQQHDEEQHHGQHQQQHQQVEQQCMSPTAGQYTRAPDVLQPHSSTDIDQQQGRQQQHCQQQQCIVPMLLGQQLQQQFPNLRPLQTYQPVWLPDAQQQQQQQQQVEAASGKQYLSTHHLAYDVLPVESSFSHHKPPQPQFSIAMPQPQCDNIPQLDELLHLAAAAAAVPARAAGAGCGHPATAAAGSSTPPSAAAAAAGQRTATGEGKAAVQGVSNKRVMFGVPDGGDVNFYELRPVQLMNLLTNDR